MAEEFDIGSFIWVKDEIDQSLKCVKDHFSAFLDMGSDVTLLRHAQTHLYQVSGALDMVGLRGCERLCAEMERLLAKLEKSEVEASPRVMGIFVQAIDALALYLQQLLDGNADVPLRLFPALQMLSALHGETVKEAELFFPDTSLRAPKDIDRAVIEAAQLSDYMIDQRKNYQKYLLDWLKTAGAESLENMRLSIENVQQVQQQSAHKTLWWVVGAFIEALSQHTIAKNTQVKRLCRQIDQRMRAEEVGYKATDIFLREILYVVALSLPLTEHIAQVKKLYELDALLPTADISDPNSSESKETDAIALPLLSHNEHDMLQVTVQQIKEALQLVEQALDIFFRTPSNQQVLEAVDEPLQQIIAAFDLIDKPLPTLLVKASAKLVVHFQRETPIVSREQNLAQYELLANSLSLLGFYVEEMPRTRPETDQALSDILAKLELQLSTNELVSSQENTVLQTTEPMLAISSVVAGCPLDTELLGVYLDEAKEVLANVAQHGQALQRDVADKNALLEIRRGFHTLKGSGRTVGLNELSEVAWMVEKLLNEIIEHKRMLSSAHLAFIEQVGQAFFAWVAQLSESGFANINCAYWQQLVDGLVYETDPSEAEKQSEIETEGEVDRQSESNSKLESALNIIDAVESVAVDGELLSIFLEEASELILQIGNALRAWQANPQMLEYAEALLRSLHTLKGSARTAALLDLANAAHGMEDHINRMAHKKISAKGYSGLFLDLDRISTLLEAAASINPESSLQLADAEAVLAGHQLAEQHPHFLRLRTDVLDTLINESAEISISRARLGQEIQGFKQSSSDLTESVIRLREYLRELEMETEIQMQSRMTHVQEMQGAFDPLEFDRFTRLQELTRMMAESVNDVATIQRGLLLNLDQAQSVMRQQNRMSQTLQHGLMAVRKVPFSLISERLQRMVRQTAGELGKFAELVIEGEALEIDRSLLDKIGAPLEHLLRNAVGHGLETPAQRKKQGKPKLGNISLKIQRENDEIVISVEDDGAGINFQRVRENAIQHGLIGADQTSSEQALLAIIFEPRITTAIDVTGISGRGVGLDAVRGDIAALGGRIEVSSTPLQSSRFCIYLPAALSVSQMVLIRVGTQIFALPSHMLEQLQTLQTEDLAEAYRTKCVSWSQHEYAIHYLADLIGNHEQKPEEQNQTPILLLRSGANGLALHVDEVIGHQEVVMKAVGSQLAHVPGISGAAVLVDGKVVLVINPVQMARLELAKCGTRSMTEKKALAPVNSKPEIMVVDDSLTMRKALSRILEREEFQVRTAKDGQDALEQLQESAPLPDLILLDIEMPRMDGFEFTRILREDPINAQIPIIIISSRTAEKHRNLAETLGVNAFMGKPVHDEAFLAQIYECLQGSAHADSLL